MDKRIIHKGNICSRLAKRVSLLSVISEVYHKNNHYEGMQGENDVDDLFVQRMRSKLSLHYFGGG